MNSAAETAKRTTAKDVEQQVETPCIGLDGDLEKQASDEATVDSTISERTEAGEAHESEEGKPPTASQGGGAPLTLAPDDPESTFHSHSQYSEADARRSESGLIRRSLSQTLEIGQLRKRCSSTSHCAYGYSP